MQTEGWGCPDCDCVTSGPNATLMETFKPSPPMNLYRGAVQSARVHLLGVKVFETRRKALQNSDHMLLLGFSYK